VKTPVDPPRLVDSADADPALRHALRLIHEDEPSLSALGVLADSTERALHAAPVTKAASAAAGKPLLVKLVIGVVAGGAMAYWGAPAAYRAAVHQPSPTAPLAPNVVPSGVAPVHATGMFPPGPSAPASAELDSEPPRPEPAATTIAAESASLTSPAGEGHGARRVPPVGPAPPIGPSSRPAAGLRGGVSEPSASETSDPGHRHGDREGLRSPDQEANEMDLLESAQQALARDPRRALSYLGEHRNAFPRSKFAQEREMLRLEAFRRLHDKAALEEGARAFVARYPKSPHRARVTRLLEEVQ
jgi:hypothetical protein